MNCAFTYTVRGEAPFANTYGGRRDIITLDRGEVLFRNHKIDISQSKKACFSHRAFDDVNIFVCAPLSYCLSMAAAFYVADVERFAPYIGTTA